MAERLFDAVQSPNGMVRQNQRYENPSEQLVLVKMHPIEQTSLNLSKNRSFAHQPPPTAWMKRCCFLQFGSDAVHVRPDWHASRLTRPDKKSIGGPCPTSSSLRATTEGSEHHGIYLVVDGHTGFVSHRINCAIRIAEPSILPQQGGQPL